MDKFSRGADFSSGAGAETRSTISNTESKHQHFLKITDHILGPVTKSYVVFGTCCPSSYLQFRIKNKKKVFPQKVIPKMFLTKWFLSFNLAISFDWQNDSDQDSNPVYRGQLAG